jgi:hydroxyacylglutathione hydrolase
MIVSMQHHLQIIPIPAFKDNYIWLLECGNQAIVVDPGDALPVLNTLQDRQLQLHAILITHHHHDHIGGVKALLTAYPDTLVYAPKRETYDFANQSLAEPDQINILGLTFEVLDVPGHTLGHIAYYLPAAENTCGKLFCGDTLFGAGCGRLFEGTPPQMYQSLRKLSALPADTEMYCTHEYTLHNIAFAIGLEPGNQALIERQQATQKIRERHMPSLPSTLRTELATNPFLRCSSSEIKASIKLENASELEVFTAIREMRNHY